jgi:hypothetical protein
MVVAWFIGLNHIGIISKKSFFLDFIGNVISTESLCYFKNPLLFLHGIIQTPIYVESRTVNIGSTLQIRAFFSSFWSLCESKRNFIEDPTSSQTSLLNEYFDFLMMKSNTLRFIWNHVKLNEHGNNSASFFPISCDSQNLRIKEAVQQCGRRFGREDRGYAWRDARALLYKERYPVDHCQTFACILF